MAECAASPSCIKLDTWRSRVKERGYALRNSHLKTAPRNYFYGRCKAVHLSMWKMCELGAPGFLNLKIRPDLRETSLRCSCLGSLVNPDGATVSDWILVGDQILLMTSIFLTYVAGVIPIQKSNFTIQKKTSNDNVNPERSTSSGSAWKNADQVNLKYAWDAVKGKLLDSLDAIEHRNSWGNRVLELEQDCPKRPLSLYALSEGPKLRLLWASFQQLEEEVNSIINNSDIVNMDDDWLTVFSEIIRKSCQPVCMAWLEKELGLENSNLDMALVSLTIEKLKGDDTVLQNIRKSGKEDLYAELLFFLRFGSLRKGCCYDHNLFISHGDSILEDLVINLADGIASNYLELISVDGNLSNEMNNLGLVVSNLSTRALQRLRNDVALNQWLYQNVEAVVSMYEDRFDLYIFHSQLIEEPGRDQIENYKWWKKLTLRKSGTTSPLRYVVISYFSMPVKRTKELRALTGWRYYFSLFLELSDISMPLIRAVFDKVSNAISFFLVCLIGRSLGLIYTGIRQSLRWK